MTRLEPLNDLWTPANESRVWRIRFTDGGIAELSNVLVKRAAGSSSASGVLLRLVRKSATVGVAVGEQLTFDLSSVRDVADDESGDMVFPPERAFQRSRNAPIRDTTEMQRWSNVRIAAIFFAVVGTISVLVGMDAWRKHAVRLQWPTTNGTLTSIEVYGIGGGARSWPSWKIDVEYWYEVRGHRYHSETMFSVDQAFNYEEEAQEQASRFSKGAPVRVYYDPITPSESYLAEGVTHRANAAVTLGGLTIMGAVVAWWLAGTAMATERKRLEASR